MKTTIQILQTIYFAIFLFSVALITLMHIIPDPALAVFRIPKDIREIGPSLGLSWPMSLHVYQVFLILFLIILLLNGIGLWRLNVARWRSICSISSFLGLFLIWSIFLFFMLPFILHANLNPKNLETSLIYSMLAFVLFIVDLLTFAVVQKAKTDLKLTKK